MRPGQPTVQFALPELPKWAWNLLVTLFALFAIELSLRNIAGFGDTLALLRWQPFGAGFQPWQPVTRYLVQGNNVFNVVIELVVLYFFLPAMGRIFDRKTALQAFGVAALGGSLFALAFNLIGLGGFGTFGWSTLVAACIVFFGLGNPNAQILLFFIIPIRALYLVYGSAALAFLSMLAGPGMLTADHFGTIIAAWGWWNYLGPGARRRSLLKRSRDIERELGGFQVLQGGKNRGGDDGIVH